MIRGILLGLLVLGCLSVGEGYECYSCPFGLCVLPGSVSCSFGQLCGTTTGSASTILGAVSLKAKGCIGVFQCLSSQTESHGGIEVTASNRCCFGNFCNSGTSARPSLLTALMALLAMLLMRFL